MAVFVGVRVRVEVAGGGDVGSFVGVRVAERVVELGVNVCVAVGRGVCV